MLLLGVSGAGRTPERALKNKFIKILSDFLSYSLKRFPDDSNKYLSSSTQLLRAM